MSVRVVRCVQTDGSVSIDDVIPCDSTFHVWGVHGEWATPGDDQLCRCGGHRWADAMSPSDFVLQEERPAIEHQRPNDLALGAVE